MINKKKQWACGTLVGSFQADGSLSDELEMIIVSDLAAEDIALEKRSKLDRTKLTVILILETVIFKELLNCVSVKMRI